MAQNRIRNFSIIAHIDHGKSTLADRFIQMCGGLPEREMAEQVLDSMDLERERGITIKAQTAALEYKARNGDVYLLNLIDTPGHVDFSYEVSRSLAACEGAVLVVDASQGVEAQTVANCYTATEQGVEVIPVLNKIDLPSADPEKAIQEIEDVIGIPAQDAIRVSAKTGENVGAILEAVISRIPPPKGDPANELQALIIDSWFDNYVGVVMLVRVMQGTIRSKEKIVLMSTGATYLSDQLGVFTPKAKPKETLAAGEVGYVTAGIKELRAAKVGDTITTALRPAAKPLPGFKEIKPQVFAGLYPVEANEYEALREALEKLHLNDASFHHEPETSQALGFGFRCGFLGLLHMDIVQERLEREHAVALITTAPSVVYEVQLRDALEKLKLNDSSLRYEPEVSQALGFGFRCGFLGLLHMEIVQERLEREFDQDLITTAPSVVYEVELNDGTVLQVENPSKMPDQGRIREIREPIVTVRLYMPQDCVGPVMTLANQKRGNQINMAYHGRQVMLTYEMPLAEIVLDFFDKLKSVSRGYASMDYDFKEYRAADVVMVDILLNGDRVDALSIIVHRSQSVYRSRAVVSKMRELISRQMYDVAIQAAIGANIIARETIKALRKNVLAKCYGGDITRKRKLLEKQKAGKKRMKQIGSVEVPQEAFLAILQVDD